MDITAYALSKKFTEDTADSLGSLKGAPCTVKSIEDIAGGHRVTFEWTGTSGQKQTSTMDVMDGEPGDKGDAGVSPAVTIEEIPGGHRVTITDEEHPQGQPFDVMDGEGGGGTTNYNSLTNKPQINGVELTGDKTTRALNLGDAVMAYSNDRKISASDDPVIGVEYPYNDHNDYLVVQNHDAGVAIGAYGEDTGVYIDDVLPNKTYVDSGLADKQDALESGTNIKTINNQSLLGTGNINIGGGGGSADLTADLTTTKAVGGIPVGKEYKEGDSLETIFRDMLNPVENPVLTDPSATIATSGATLLEAGTTVNKTFTITFNRGSINPKYGTSGYRAGVATGYSLNGGASQSGNTFNAEVTESNKTFSGSVSYAQGEQPKNSAGENYSTPLPAGSVNTSNTVTFEFVDALWSNAANIAVVAKEALVSKSAKLKQFNFPAQTAENPEVFDVPASWSVTAVELLNPLSGQWVSCVSEFDVSDVTHGAVAYKRYTYNGGGATGARSVRIKWS